MKTEFPTGFHIHAPSGATPKDGPSAGCAFATAFVSRILKIAQEKDLIHKRDGYAWKGKPGELNSYIYFGAAVSFLPNKACNQLERLFDISRDIQIPD